jgi:hypothetical protein
LAIAGQVGAVALGPICGKTIDPLTFGLPMAFTIGMTLLDWIKRHYTKDTSNPGSTVIPLHQQSTPSQGTQADPFAIQ